MSSQSTSPGPGRPGVWWDDPLADAADDRLGRAAFANHAARLISDNHSPDTSVVYGLEGPWGSGKSTVINFIKKRLEEPTGGTWQVVHFTPWATSGPDALFNEFFNALVQVAPKEKSGQALREKLGRYALIARPLVAGVPGIGGVAVEASRSIEDAFRKPWNAAFADVSAELSSIGASILVVVDDIDRLQPQELLDLLKVVRLLGRFPGVDFLLAYDERTIVDTLQDPQRGTVTKERARAFMEKIVQYPLTLPPLLRQTVIDLLDEGLTDIITQPRIDARLDVRRLQPVLTETMPRLLRTPRAVARFLAQVRAQVEVHHPDEVDDVDLVLSTLLRVRFPDLYEELQHHRRPLTAGSPNGVLRPRPESAPTDWSPLLSLVGDLDRDEARAVLAAIFPAVADSHPAQARAPRFAHPQYFDRYLAQAIPAGDIPDVEIAEALRRASTDDDQMLRDFLLSTERGRSALALSRMASCYPSVSEPWRRDELRGPISVALLGAGMRLLGELPAGRETLVNPVQVLSYWMSNLLTWISHDDPGAHVHAALDRCPDVTLRAHVVSTARDDPDERLPEATRVTLNRLFDAEGKRVLDLLLEDLMSGDASSGVDGNSFLYELVVEAGLLDDLRDGIKDGLGKSQFSIEDVAARFVGFYWTIGVGAPRPSGAKFSGSLFTRVTGVPATSSDHIERDDEIDTSWSGRRAIAAAHLADAADPS